MKKAIAILMLILCLCMAFTACKKDDETDKKSDKTAVTTAAQSEKDSSDDGAADGDSQPSGTDEKETTAGGMTIMTDAGGFGETQSPDAD